MANSLNRYLRIRNSLDYYNSNDFKLNNPFCVIANEITIEIKLPELKQLESIFKFCIMINITIVASCVPTHR